MNTIYLDRMYVDDFLIIEFWAETDHPNELITEINRYLKTYDITEQELERYKKVWIASEIMMTDNVSSTVSSLINDIIEYGEIKRDRVNYIRKMNYQKLLSIRKKLDFSNSATLILKTKDEKDD